MDNCMCLKCIRERGDTVELDVGINVPLEMTRMIICETCGNKRCPHAASHANACTNSNDPGQPGSNY